MFTYSIKFLFLIKKKLKTVTRFKEIFIIQIAFHLNKTIHYCLRTEKLMTNFLHLQFWLLKSLIK